MNEGDKSIFLYTKITPDLKLQWFIMLCVFLGMPLYFWIKQGGEFNSNQIIGMWDAGKGILSIFGPIIIFQIWLNKWYKISYDDDALYMGGREWQWRKLRFVRVENRLAYEDIAEIATTPGEANVQPFEYILFRREGGEWEEQFFVSRIYLLDDEIRELLQFMYTKCPEKYPQELIDFMYPYTIR
jgi:hypothetical protein